MLLYALNLFILRSSKGLWKCQPNIDPCPAPCWSPKPGNSWDQWRCIDLSYWLGVPYQFVSHLTLIWILWTFWTQYSFFTTIISIQENSLHFPKSSCSYFCFCFIFNYSLFSSNCCLFHLLNITPVIPADTLQSKHMADNEDCKPLQVGILHVEINLKTLHAKCHSVYL